MKLRAEVLPVSIVLLIASYLFFITWSSEKRLGEGAEDAPQPITIEQLEAGPPANPYLVLGPHSPLYSLVVYETDKDGTVTEAWYPVVSRARYDSTMKSLKDRHHGKLKEVTKEEFGAAMTVKVLLKTRAFKTRAALQTALDQETLPHDNIGGLVLNHVAPLGESEIGFLKKAYPSFDAEQAVYFDVDRAPTPSATLLKYLLGSIGCAVLAIGILIKR